MTYQYPALNSANESGNNHRLIWSIFFARSRPIFFLNIRFHLKQIFKILENSVNSIFTTIYWLSFRFYELFEIITIWKSVFSTLFLSNFILSPIFNYIIPLFSDCHYLKAYFWACNFFITLFHVLLLCDDFLFLSPDEPFVVASLVVFFMMAFAWLLLLHIDMILFVALVDP